MKNIIEVITVNKRVFILLLITASVSLLCLLSVSMLKNRKLPEGFKRGALVGGEVVKPDKLKPQPAAQLTVSPGIIEQAKEKMLQDWGRDPFIFMPILMTEDYGGLRVTAILITKDSRWACINGKIVKAGDRFGNREIAEINEAGVEFTNIETMD